MLKGILLVILVTATAGLPQQRRLRVKTIENITAEVTTAQTLTTSATHNDIQQARKPTATPGSKRIRRPAATQQPEIDKKEGIILRRFNKEQGKNGDNKKTDTNQTLETVQSGPENTVISTNNNFIVNSSDADSSNSTPLFNSTELSTKPRKKISRNGKRRSNNHIHVESNYSVTSALPKGNTTENNSWKNSTIKENVRRKNILSRTSSDPVGVGSESRIQVLRSRQGSPHFQADPQDGKENKTRVRSRPLVKPQKNAKTVYNFETGKLQHKKSEDQSPSTSNEVPNEKRVADDLYKIKNQHEENAPAQPQKRYSSRYKGKKHYGRGNHASTTENAVNVREVSPSPGHLNEENYRAYGHPEIRKDEGERTVEVEQAEASPEIEEEKIADHKEAPNGDVGPKEIDGGGEGKKEEKYSEGSEKETHSDFHATKGEKHKKGYKGGHGYDKGSKGFHDKEQHSGEYRDEKGSKKAHNEGGGHFEAGQHEEKGQKSADHAEKEEYKKGHSTRGGHVVHKLDEYEKKLEFFDESYDSGDGEKFGSYFESFGGKKGGHKKGGHKNSKSSGDHKAKKGKYVKGKHHHEDKGHDKKGGKDGFFTHAEKFGKEEGNKNIHKYHFSVNKGEGGTGGESSRTKGHPTESSQELKEDDTEENEQLRDPVDDADAGEEEADNTTKHNEKATETDSEGEKEISTKDKEDESLQEENAHLEGGESDSDELGKLTAKIPPKNAEFMNEDGPTSYFTRRAKEKTAEVEDSGTEIDEDVPNSGQSSSPYLPDDIPRGKGYFMAEEELAEDKEGDEALEVFNHLHEDGNDDEHRQRNYQVSEEEAEPANEESRTRSQRIQFKEPAPVVKIVTKSILPPL